MALTREQALRISGKVIRYVVRMLCAGLIHGDLGVQRAGGRRGPVIIDLPQVVMPPPTTRLQAMLERDVDNMRNYYGMYAPSCLQDPVCPGDVVLVRGWQAGPRDRALTGLFEESREAIDLDGVLHEIESAQEEAMACRARLQAEQGRGVLTAFIPSKKSAMGALCFGTLAQSPVRVAPLRRGPW